MLSSFSLSLQISTHSSAPLHFPSPPIECAFEHLMCLFTTTAATTIIYPHHFLSESHQVSFIIHIKGRAANHGTVMATILKEKVLEVCKTATALPEKHKIWYENRKLEKNLPPPQEEGPYLLVQALLRLHLVA